MSTPTGESCGRPGFHNCGGTWVNHAKLNQFEVPRPEAVAYDPSQHEYVSPACAHRRHHLCDQACAFCSATCLCSCHRWVFADPRQ